MSLESEQRKRQNSLKLKQEIGQEHFKIGTNAPTYLTTNKELMKSNSMPNIRDFKTQNQENKQIKEMMRNHHFEFGTDKPQLSSTSRDYYKKVGHNFKVEDLAKDRMINRKSKLYMSLKI